jgi:hypothetical protein
LRPSLNAPVLLVDELPAGPASAAIVCLGGPAGPRVAVAIRSERSGQVIFYGPDDELWEWHGPEVAVEAALSFAESMGFLFEDDRMADAPAEAQRLFAALLDAAVRHWAEPRPAERSAERAPAPLAREPEEASLEEHWLEEVEAEITLEVPPVSHAVPLTKFRQAVPVAVAANRALSRFRAPLAGRVG